MLSTNKLKKIKSNFPVLVGDNVVSKNICNLLIKEISNSKSFDDMIMGGRSRINKGSNNFNLYIKTIYFYKKFFTRKGKIQMIYYISITVVLHIGNTGVEPVLVRPKI